jgi:hypothetical protein
MQDRHDDKQNPRLPSHAAHDCHLTDAFQSLTMQARSVPGWSCEEQCRRMPDPELSTYFNKQSGKVNSGLSLFDVTQGCRPRSKGANEDTLFAEVDFRQFNVPARFFATAPANPPTEQLVQSLLHPPAHAFLHGVISFHWIVGTLGFCHFVLRESDERYILSTESAVRTEGLHFGLPNVLLEWLCGTMEHSSPTEQAMLFTKDFFQGLSDEQERGLDG